MELDDEFGNFVEFGLSPARAVNGAGAHGYDDFMNSDLNDFHGQCPFPVMVYLILARIVNGIGQYYSFVVLRIEGLYVYVGRIRW